MHWCATFVGQKWNIISLQVEESVLSKYERLQLPAISEPIGFLACKLSFFGKRVQHANPPLFHRTSMQSRRKVAPWHHQEPFPAFEVRAKNESLLLITRHVLRLFGHFFSSGHPKVPKWKKGTLPSLTPLILGSFPLPSSSTTIMKRQSFANLWWWWVGYVYEKRETQGWIFW